MKNAKLRYSQEARISAMNEIKRLNKIVMNIPDNNLNYLDGRRIVSLLTELGNLIFDELKESLPTYVKSADGYIGHLDYIDSDFNPVYRFPGGCRVADEYELSHGSNRRADLVKDGE